MPIVKDICSNGIRVAAWRIDESEAELMAVVDCAMVLPRNARGRIQRLAVLNLLAQMGFPAGYQSRPNGAPYFTDRHDSLSISHAEKMVAVAVSDSVAVGVDVECVNRDYRRVAAKFLSQHEMEWVDMENRNDLALIWCVKEAVYKLPWGCSKCFSTDIEVSMMTNGCEARVMHLGEWLGIPVSFTYIDDYCLAWVTKIIPQ